MRIAFFVWEYPPTLVGGLGTYAENITRKFVQLGHEVVVFTLNRGELPAREYVQGVEVHRPIIADASRVLPLLVAEDVRRWGAGIRFFSDIVMYNLLSVTKLLNDLIRGEGYTFDIVSFHDWLGGIGGMMMKRNSGMPCVFHVHSTEWGRTRGEVSAVVMRIEEEAAETADRIITVSNVMKEDLTRHGWPQDKISVVWNGVDPDKYDPLKVKREDVEKVRERYSVKGNGPMILFVGRLTPVKGVHSLMAAMPEVVKEHPKAKLVVLGAGEQEQEVTKILADLKLEENVGLRFQFVPEEERILHIAAANLCVFPSTYEPFGIVSLEAMAMGKPVVVGANGVVGFREQVVPNGSEQCGVHVNGADPADIAWGIKEVLSDPQRANGWGQNGRKRVIQSFNWTKAAEETLRIYSELINRR